MSARKSSSILSLSFPLSLSTHTRSDATSISEQLIHFIWAQEDSWGLRLSVGKLGQVDCPSSTEIF